MQIIFLFYDGMTALDAVGPHEILCRLPGVSVKRIAKLPGRITTDSGLILNADYALSDVSYQIYYLFQVPAMLQRYKNALKYLNGCVQYMTKLSGLRQYVRAA